MIACSVWADRVANYVRDVAVPCGFARPWWKVRLRGAVPSGSAKRAWCKCGVSLVNGIIGGFYSVWADRVAKLRP